MNEREQQQVSLFQNLQAVTSKAVSLKEIIRLIRYDAHVEAETAIFRRMAQVHGKKRANSEVKASRLPACSVAVLFDGLGRKATHALSFTGLAMCDIDHLDDIETAMQRISEDPHTLIAYRTVSGEGVRIFYRYRREQESAPVDGTVWPAAFLTGNSHYARLTGHESDLQCADCEHLSGLAHDDKVWVNLDAEPFVISDEDIVEENLSTGCDGGRERTEDPAGTHSVRAEEAWERVEQTLRKRHIVYQSGRHHDYVMHAAFLFNRYGVALDDLCRWAEGAWGDYDSREREATIRSCYRRTAEHGTWRLVAKKEKREQKGQSILSLPEIRRWLDEHVEVIYNVVTDMTMYRHKEKDGEWQQVDDRVVCSMRAQMAKDTGRNVVKGDVVDVLRSDFSRLVHPVRDYIESLPAWDGTDRIAELTSHVTTEAMQRGQSGQEATELFSWSLHKWLVGSLATWMSDHVANHEIFVLIGRQGLYKTTFFRHLLPPALRMYYMENAHNSFSSKDDHLSLSENCLVEIEEIDMQSPRDVSELKALVTSDKVKERRPYARFREEKARLAAFCASGNQERFLIDETGNRRWLCFKVTHIDDPRTWGIDYDQLYAQLRDEWRGGFRYWFDSDDERRIEEQNQAFRMESDEEQLIRTHLRPPYPGEKPVLMNAAAICQYINGGAVGRGLSSRKVGILMSKLGFTKVHTRKGWFYEVYQLSQTDQQKELWDLDETDKNGSHNEQNTQQELPF